MEKAIKELIKIFWLFILGSFIGFAYETMLVLVRDGHFESRQGLIYGPFTPVYGIGIIVYYLFFRLTKIEGTYKVFLCSMVLGGITEYISSYVQEKCFGTISWDYSYLRFNLNGRTSLLHCTYWGIAGVVYYKCVKPFIDKLDEIIKTKAFKAVTIACVGFMVFDIAISCLAAERQEERLHNIPASSRLETFLDRKYPDELMDKVYANKKVKN